ncbi:HypC/HybG/HupF family hydrogenase formation chaperone [Candidatus Fermentibacterales bacterium]|nr:HypC/HybG/HupF family hydrogenase formation chaperone [Candidatus Fermentibacterales bacterium]
MCLGVPGQIIEIEEPQDGLGGDLLDRRGRVSFAGVVREVCLAGVPDAKKGDWVIVHAGFALNTLDEEEAAEVFEYLGQISRIAREDSLSRDGPAEP